MRNCLGASGSFHFLATYVWCVFVVHDPCSTVIWTMQPAKGLSRRSMSPKVSCDYALCNNIMHTSSEDSNCHVYQVNASNEYGAADACRAAVFNHIHIHSYVYLYIPGEFQNHCIISIGCLCPENFLWVFFVRMSFPSERVFME